MKERLRLQEELMKERLRDKEELLKQNMELMDREKRSWGSVRSKIPVKTECDDMKAEVERLSTARVRPHVIEPPRHTERFVATNGNHCYEAPTMPAPMYV